MQMLEWKKKQRSRRYIDLINENAIAKYNIRLHSLNAGEKAETHLITITKAIFHVPTATHGRNYADKIAQLKVSGRNDEASVIRLYVKSQVINCYGEAERPHRNKIFFPF